MLFLSVYWADDGHPKFVEIGNIKLFIKIKFG